MKNPASPILLAFLSFSLSLPASNGTPGTTNSLQVSRPEERESDILYTSLELDKHNLSRAAFEKAWVGHNKLTEQNRLVKPRYLSICDLSQSSRQKRFYLIDLEEKKLILNTYVAHGRNSGGEFACRFSNRPSSLQTSLGFYVTDQTYYGEHGLSLKIRGLEPGINDRAMERRIVIHGADYAEPRQIYSRGYLGRSFGCPALPKKQSHSIINTIKNGSCFFIYHPSDRYEKTSKILNG